MLLFVIVLSMVLVMVALNQFSFDLTFDLFIVKPEVVKYVKPSPVFDFDAMIKRNLALYGDKKFNVARVSNYKVVYNTLIKTVSFDVTYQGETTRHSITMDFNVSNTMECHYIELYVIQNFGLHYTDVELSPVRAAY